MTDAERDEERRRRDLTRCPTCGVPWVEHSPECSRHKYRPECVWWVDVDRPEFERAPAAWLAEGPGGKAV